MRNGFVTNIDRCVGCNACEIACKAYYGLEPDMKRRKVQTLDENIVGDSIRAHLSYSCNHCEKPSCLEVCPVAAISKREDGIVLIDKELCIGCRECEDACPYNSPTFNSVTNKMDKCDLCATKPDGVEPICVHSCPMNAISNVDMDKIDESAYVKDVEGFPKQSTTDANLRLVMPHSVKQIRL